MLNPRKRRRNQEPERRNRQALLEQDRGYNLIFPLSHIHDESPLASELLAFTIHRKTGRYDVCMNNINSKDSALQAQGTKDLANLLETDWRLVKLLTPDDVDRFVGFLELDKVLTYRDIDAIQYHAASVLKLVFSSNCLDEVIANKAIPLLVKLLDIESCQHYLAVRQALSTLTELIYKFPHFSKSVLRLGVLAEPLKKIVSRWNFDYKMLSECAKLLGAICKEHPDLSTIERNVAFDIARTMLHHDRAPESCVTLAKLSDGRPVEVVDRDCEVLFYYLDAYLPSNIIYALEVIGNIARWSNALQIQCMITNGVMQPLQCLLSNEYKIVRREACWIISNIIAVNDKEDVIKKDLVEVLCGRLDNDELEVKLESGWAILNLIYNESIDIRVLKMICLETLVRQQKCQHLGIVDVCTKAIQMLQLDTEDTLTCQFLAPTVVDGVIDIAVCYAKIERAILKQQVFLRSQVNKWISSDGGDDKSEGVRLNYGWISNLLGQYA